MTSPLPPHSGPPSPAPSSPAVGAGPGVKVPFAAPPSDKDNSKAITFTIIGCVIAIVLCAGAVVGFFGVLSWVGDEYLADAEETVDTFMTDIVTENYSDAYQSVCEPTRNKISKRDFVEEWNGLDIASFDVQSPSMTGSEVVVVPVDTSSDNNDAQMLRIEVVTNPETGDTQVCGW